MSLTGRLTLVLTLILSLTGCAGYRIGPTPGVEYRSVAVVMLRNKTYQPQIEVQITSAIIRAFQADGSLQIESVANADVVVTGEITQYRRHELRTQRNDSSAPDEYRITIEARIEARDRVTGKIVLAPTRVTGSGDTFIGNDLQSAEQQVLPLVANDLAKRVVTLLAEKW
jgi:hypothetical protein